MPWSFSTCSASSRTPFAPAPETDWYEDRLTAFRPAARCSGASAISAVMIVQFGTA